MRPFIALGMIVHFGITLACNVRTESSSPFETARQGIVLFYFAKIEGQVPDPEWGAFEISRLADRAGESLGPSRHRMDASTK